MKEPTTREILNILYNQIEGRRKQYAAPGKTDIESLVRFSECGIIQAMIVGLENEYNL